MSQRFSSSYGIGGNEVRVEGSEGITEIPQNRTLIAQKLTSKTPTRPEVVEGLKTVEDVFEHFKPNVDVSYEDASGQSIKENLKFKTVGDFGVKGLVNQSPFLGDLQTKSDQYQKIIKQLKTNKILKLALQDPEAKQSMIEAIDSLIQELDSSEK